MFHNLRDSNVRKLILAKASEKEERRKGFNPSLTHAKIPQDIF
jgi:hypothetical protein